jgi:murein DD-endopeptidase MepM/ murein hydrolase activator NlpD
MLWGNKIALTNVFEQLDNTKQLAYDLTNKIRIMELDEQFDYLNPIHIDDFVRPTSPFGIRTVPDEIYTGGATERMHGGVDLVGTWHARVVASANGRVIDKWFVPDGKYRNGHATFGGYIRILHIDGSITGYAHLSAIYVREGDIVSQGDVIGRTGNTGLSTGDHLHFSLELTKDDFVNPLSHIKLR